MTFHKGVFVSNTINDFLVGLYSQPNFPALLQGRSAAETITCVCVPIKSATKWTTVVTTLMKKSAVRTECILKYPTFGFGLRKCISEKLSFISGNLIKMFRTNNNNHVSSALWSNSFSTLGSGPHVGSPGIQMWPPELSNN